MERTVKIPSTLIGSRASVVLIHGDSCGGARRDRERSMVVVVLMELLSVSVLSLRVFAPKLCFLGQSVGSAQSQPDNGLPSFFSWTQLHCRLSFSAAADYDVHSLLSAWLRMASNQQPALQRHSPCSRSPQHSRNYLSFFFPLLFFLSWTMTCFLLFVVTLPAESHQTKT